MLPLLEPNFNSIYLVHMNDTLSEITQRTQEVDLSKKFRKNSFIWKRIADLLKAYFEVDEMGFQVLEISFRKILCQQKYLEWGFGQEHHRKKLCYGLYSRRQSKTSTIRYRNNRHEKWSNSWYSIFWNGCKENEYRNSTNRKSITTSILYFA